MKTKHKTPTLREKVKKYEELLHIFQLHAEVCMNPQITRQLIDNICHWSYAHRVGNGELSDREQQQIINFHFWRLTDIDDCKEKE